MNSSFRNAITFFSFFLFIPSYVFKVPNIFFIKEQSTSSIQQNSPDLTVNSTEDTDDGFCEIFVLNVSDCTLREAIKSANIHVGIDTIIFSDELTSTTLILSSSLPNITDTAGVIINGGYDIVIDGNDKRVFYINSTASLELRNITITNGAAYGYGLRGGGVYNNDGKLKVSDSVFSYNAATSGGGAIFNSENGSINIERSLFIENSTGGGGGGIQNNGEMTVSNSTFYANHANSGGGGIMNYGFPNYQYYRKIINSTFFENTDPYAGGVYTSGTTWMYNTIIANSGLGRDCYLSQNSSIVGNNNLITSANNSCNLINGVNGNIVGIDAKIGSLIGFPGFLLLDPNSPAINKGDDAICGSEVVNQTSQNGVTRPVGGHCDIGSFEYINSTTPPKIASITRLNPSPTNINLINFIVNFTENVTGVKLDGSDFTITTSPEISGAYIVKASIVSPKQYSVTVNTGTGDGTIRLDLLGIGEIKNLSALSLSGIPFTNSEVYLIDKTSPETQLTPQEYYTNNTSSIFMLSSSEANTRFECSLDNAPFAICISPFYVVNTNYLSHTLQVQAIDMAGNADPTPISFNWNIDPISPTINSIVRTNNSPISTETIEYQVIFSEDVQGVNRSVFTLTTTGIRGAFIANVTSISSSIYTVSVNTGAGTGTIRLDFINTTNSIIDINGNKLVGLPFTSGDSYTIIKSSPKLISAPRLSLPKQNSVLSSIQPSFSWSNVANALEYEIEVATDSTFTQLVFRDTSVTSSYTATSSLVDGKYFWHVRAVNIASQPGKYSSTQTFTIDTIPPLPPTLTSPMDSATLRSAPVFRWNKPSSAVLYEFQYDNDADFSSPSYSVTTKNNNIKPPVMPNGTFFWRVRAQDTAGNWSNWSSVRSVTINR